jgi:deoxyribonuclease-4
VLNQRSLLSFTAELQRCTALGIPYIVSHPGNYMDDPQAGLERNSSGYAKALQAVRGT